MPRQARRRFRPERSRSRLESFLRTRCFVCLNSPSDHPSKRLGCCSQFIHEECLLSSLQYARGQAQGKCPHCRQPITCYNVWENIPHGSHPFCFEHYRYPPPPAPPPSADDWLQYFTPAGDPDLIDYYEDRFLNPPPPTPPPGWHYFRQNPYPSR